MPQLADLLANLQSKDVATIKKALDQLGDLGDARAIPPLLQILKTTTEEEIIESILWTLSRIAPPEILVKLLNSNEKIIIEVLDALGRCQAPEAVDPIIPFLTHKNNEIRAMATWALGKIHANKTYNLLINLLKTDQDPSVRANAAWAISKFEKPESIPVLSDLKTQEQDDQVLFNLEEALEHLETIKDPWRTGIKATVYECEKRDSNCNKRDLRTESKFDEVIKIELLLCDTCSLAKICRITLIKKIP